MKRIFLVIMMALALTGCIGTSKMVVVVKSVQEPIEFELQYEIQ